MVGGKKFINFLLENEQGGPSVRALCHVLKIKMVFVLLGCKESDIGRNRGRHSQKHLANLCRKTPFQPRLLSTSHELREVQQNAWGHTYSPRRQAQKKEGWISGVLERSCVLELSGQSRYKH